MNISEYINKLEVIMNKGGPNTSEYNYLKEATLNMRSMSLIDEKRLHEIMKPILNINTMIGHTFLKPYGYAGDHELISKIYNKTTSNHKEYKKWDDLYHAADSANAVRNRKKYFINEVTKAKNASNNKTFNILNLGSGPCTDLYEYLNQHPNNKINFDCVDMDKKAIEYASVVCDNYSDSINFINKNVFRFRPTKQYNLIWSAGLFDYFSDKLFVRLIKRIYEMLNSNGEMVIGNFSTNNPSRGLMEVFCQWYLHHRDENTLINLALQADIPRKKIAVRSEDTGINLFLHLKK